MPSVADIFAQLGQTNSRTFAANANNQPFNSAMLPSQGSMPMPTMPVAALPKAAAVFNPATHATLGHWPTNYRDPTYDVAEAAASIATGVPQEILRAIRVDGEKSNNGQVSPAGAKTPYQFTPETRMAFLKQSKGLVDAYADPGQGAMAAALHLKESYQRTGSWQAAVAAYNGGTKAEKAVAAGQAPPAAETQNYLARVSAGLGINNPFATGGGGTGFNPQAFAPALSALNQGEAAALKPQSVTAPRDPMPEAPAVPDMPTLDTSKQDAALAAMAPKAFSPEEQSQEKRRMLLQGAAQALASLPEDAGVGSILAKVGAGMLGGRLAADADIQKRADDFDKEMQQYHAFEFQNEKGKAETALQQANKHVEMAWQANGAKYQTAVQDWMKNGGGVEMGPNGEFVTRTKNPDGSITATTIPNVAQIHAAFAERRANVFGTVAQESNAATVAQQHMLEGAVLGTALAQSTADRQAAADVGANPFGGAGGGGTDPTGSGLVTSAAIFAGQASTAGLWKPMMQEAGLDPAKMEQAANQAAGIPMDNKGNVLLDKPPSEAQLNAKKAYITSRLTQLFLTPDPKDPNKPGPLVPVLKKYAPALVSLERADQRVSRRTTPKGTSVTTTTNPD